MRRLIPFFALLAGCGASGAKTSQTQDIYTNDGQTRHHATVAEVVWTVWVNGCAGIALNDQYVMTANHCQPMAGMKLTTGVGLLHGQVNDMSVDAVPESSATLDYAIAKVSWAAGTPTAGQGYPPSVATKVDDVVLGKDGVGTELETVGFPVDLQQQATTSIGYAKQYQDTNLYYDVGIINGNSGGGVWRVEDHMLVSLANHGPHEFNEAGWNNNNPEDPNAWNFGAAIYQVYAQSALLQQLFPNGHNASLDH